MASTKFFALLTPLDVILAGALSVGALCYLPATRGHNPTTMVVYRDSEKIARYPLSQDRTILVQGATGPCQTIGP